MGGDSKPRPKQCPITSPDRPGPLVFQRATLKNWVGPGYEAKVHKIHLAISTAIVLALAEYEFESAAQINKHYVTHSHMIHAGWIWVGLAV